MNRYRAHFIATYDMTVEVLADSEDQALELVRSGVWNGVFAEPMIEVVGDIELGVLETDLDLPAP